MDTEDEQNLINIRPPDYKTFKKGIQSIDSTILQKHFATMVIGRPDSGKTHLIYEFLANPDLYSKKFNDIIFVTPVDQIGGIDLKPLPNHSKKFDLNWIGKQFEIINSKIKMKYPNPDSVEQKYGKGVDPFNVLLVLDDCVADIKKNQFEPLLKSIFFNRRHIIQHGCLSVLVTSQYYVEFPKALRSNLSGLIVFNCCPADWKKIMGESVHGTKIITQEVQDVVDEIFKKDKSFLYIDVLVGKMYYGFKLQLNVQLEEEKINKKIKIQQNAEDYIEP